MIETIKSYTESRKSTIEISDDRKSVAVFSAEVDEGTRNWIKIMECPIESLWDMLKDNLAVLDVGPSDAGLFRRKKEALAAIERGMRLF